MTETEEVGRRAAQLAALDAQYLYPRYEGGSGQKYRRAIVMECIDSLDIERPNAELAGTIVVCAVRLSRLQGNFPKVLIDRGHLLRVMQPEFDWYQRYKGREPIVNGVVQIARKTEVAPLSELEHFSARMIGYAAVLATGHCCTSANAWEDLMAAFDAALLRYPTSA